VGSLLPQLSERDQVFVIADGYGLAQRFMPALHRPNVFYLEMPYKGDFGCTPIDHVTPLAKGDFICYLGDDDIATQDALEHIRLGVLMGRHLPHIFGMQCLDRILSGSIDYCQVSGQQIVVPNDGKTPKYVGHPVLSDWDFILRVTKQYGEIIYHDELIAIMPQRGEGQIW